MLALHLEDEIEIKLHEIIINDAALSFSKKKKGFLFSKLLFTSLSEVLIYIRLAQMGRFSLDSLSGYGYSQKFVLKVAKDFPVVY